MLGQRMLALHCSRPSLRLASSMHPTLTGTRQAPAPRKWGRAWPRP